jgi:plasmid stabilization system protein ParE
VKLKWTKFAVASLDEITDDMVARRGNAAARRVATRLLAAVERLSTLPRSGPPWPPAGDIAYRRLVVDEYVLLYRVDEARSTVFILALRHGRRRPLKVDDIIHEE